jgi:hypothetical protein
LWAVTGLWFVTPDSRPAAAVVSWNANIAVVVNERHLKRILTDYATYYHSWRTHLSLETDCPEPREIQATDRGRVVEFPEIGGLHHHYPRVVA